MRIRDPGWKKFGSGIWDGKNSDPKWKKFGSGINIPDPQQWFIFWPEKQLFNDGGILRNLARF
jgi:hypothetical protein